MSAEPRSLPDTRLFQRLAKNSQNFPDKPAIVDPICSKTYVELLRDILATVSHLINAVNQTAAIGRQLKDLHDCRIAAVSPNSYSLIVAHLATMAAGGCFVPLLHTLPNPEIAGLIKTAEPCLILYDDSSFQKAEEVAATSKIPTLSLNTIVNSSPSEITKPDFHEFDSERPGFMLFTSGSTGAPKGVPLRHSAINSQCESMTECWGWTNQDRILNVLPVHHIHGSINVTFTALWNGATVEIQPKFDPAAIWARWMSPQQEVTVFSAVPTIYSRLLDQYNQFSEEDKAQARESCRQFRLMISGSAPLPSTLKEAWKEISGQVLSERMGMTETGMILSCGLDIESRVDGHVGMPMPGVTLRLWDAENDKDVTTEVETPGEIQVKGPLIFREYWRRPDATAKEFTADGFFKTGDIGVRTEGTGYYRIQGRSSVDIIKTGGEKCSALEIERVILSLDCVRDVAIVGVPDAKWGEAVGAVIVLENTISQLDLKQLRNDLKPLMANYKIPQKLYICAENIPRNAMGKVNKKELVKIAFPST